MTSYVPPLRDMWFVMDQVLGLPAAWAQMAPHAELDADTARLVLEEAGRFTADILAPTNSAGDLEGCRLENGNVTTPKGYRQAYQAYVEGGWPALACDPEAGGQGLPKSLNAALLEMTAAANHAWSMYAGLLHSAYACLHAYASPELKERYLAKVVSGEWASTMCLTEPQAGSDLGLLRSRAEPQPDGSYAVSGNKIFISGGEHDLTDNILHLVLARLPDAPAGTRGISLFLVPKVLPAELGGERNAVYCDGIEKKMGIKGSSTCAMRFDNAKGWIVGEPNRGLQAMFVMMNAARLQVALQGLGHADASFNRALNYAAERLQSRAPVRATDKPADPLVAHPAMRRSLLDQRCVVEGGRVLAYWAGHLLDVAEGDASPEQRAQAEEHLALLTPVLKSYLTDAGFQVASKALQVFGGYGYVHEYEVEQTLRDSRIALIYEGTNEIQGIDLLVRKVVPDGGKRLHGLLDTVLQQVRAPGTEPGYVQAVERLAAAVREVIAEVCELSGSDAEAPYRVADDFLNLTAVLLMAYAWATTDRVAAAGQGESPEFLAAKREAAAHYFRYGVPEAGLYLARIRAGREPLAQIGMLA